MRTETFVHQKSSTRTIATGFALFAMFFGAGNMVFPLYLGANAGDYLMITALAFVFVGVGTPFLGLVAVGLFQGDYWNFFGRLGKLPAFLIIAFLILIIGPLSAAPRTEVITYQALFPFLPPLLNNSMVFSLLFCAVTYVLTFREMHVVDIIGYKITPIKLTCFLLLIVLGLSQAHYSSPIPGTMKQQFLDAVSMGYGTMDMLGAFFFCATAMRSIKNSAEKIGITDEKRTTALLIKSCFIGGALLGLIYLGFMLAAAAHADILRGHSPDKLIAILSQDILTQYGAIFVGIAVTFACLATSIALADVSSDFFHRIIFRKKIGKNTCLTGVMLVMFVMTQLGFSGIMKIAMPILQVLYPSLIMLCIVNILYKLYGFKYVKTPVLVTAITSYIITLFA